MTAYLGFSCSQHDPSVAVIGEQGDVLFAQANERALKNKRGWHSPPDAFGLIEPILDRYVGTDLVSANLTWSNAALATVPAINRLSRWAVAALERFLPPDRDAWLYHARIAHHALYRASSSSSELLLNLDIRIAERQGFRRRASKRAWYHHLCHAMTGCFSSPFEDALCVVMDGMGEGSSTAVYRFQGDRLHRLDRQPIVNLASLGHLYSMLCFVAGFDPHAGEEWKLMGLAGHGALDDDLYRTLRDLLVIKDARLKMSTDIVGTMQRLMPLRERRHMKTLTSPSRRKRCSRTFSASFWSICTGSGQAKTSCFAADARSIRAQTARFCRPRRSTASTCRWPQETTETRWAPPCWVGRPIIPGASLPGSRHPISGPSWSEARSGAPLSAVSTDGTKGRG